MVEKRDGCQILFLKFNPFSAILFYTDIILGRKNSDWSEFGCKEEDWTFGEQSWKLVWFLLHLWGVGGLNRQVNRVRKKERCPWHWSQNYHILYYLRKNMRAFFSDVAPKKRKECHFRLSDIIVPTELME